MVTREQEALERTEAMLKLITGQECFAKALARHFGDDLPDGKKECSHCTWCMTRKQVVQEMPAPVPFNRQAWDRILDLVPDRNDPRYLAKSLWIRLRRLPRPS